MTGQGGWPMSVFLTPDGKPFYGGTYFPPPSRPTDAGVPPGARGVAAPGATSGRRSSSGRRARPGEIAGSRRPGDRFSAPTLDAPCSTRPTAAPRARLRCHERRLGRRPKFPQPMTIEFLLGARLRPATRVPLHRAAHARRDGRGGIHDQLGGGFHRYATDAIWLVPHFEKMLYDNAQLARADRRAGRRAPRERAPAAVRGAPGTAAARARRQGPDRVERADDRRACGRRRGVWPHRLVGRGRGGGQPAADPGARRERPPLAVVEGRPSQAFRRARGLRQSRRRAAGPPRRDLRRALVRRGTRAGRDRPGPFRRSRRAASSTLPTTTRRSSRGPKASRTTPSRPVAR
jgi:hypothetical protein